MRSIIVSEFISLDGIFDDPGGSEKTAHGGWTVPYWNEEVSSYKKKELFAADALLLGHTTYAEFTSTWPPLAGRDEFAKRMNTIKKYVVSDTIKETPWENSEIIRGPDVLDELKKLKQSPGKDILVAGSGELVASLIPQKIVDEFRFLVYPVVLGTGKHFWENDISAKLNLVEARRFPLGVVLLRYDLNIHKEA